MEEAVSKKEFLVLSDIHLMDVEDNDDGWKYYKSSRYLCDRDLHNLIVGFEKAAVERGNEPVLVLNGDIFDFDLVTDVPKSADFDVSLSEKWRGLRPTAEKSAWKLSRIMDNHPMFNEALAGFLAKGHKLVYVMGNHDREFHFQEVKDTFLARLSIAASRSGTGLHDPDVEFHPWFYYVPGTMYVEHGQQYDHYTSFRYVLEPTVELDGVRQLALPMGNISNRYLMTKMGYFNPHASDYILNVFRYFWHWLTFYAFSRRSLAFNWFVGSLVVMGKLLRMRRKLLMHPPNQRELLEREARDAGMDLGVIQKLAELQRPPITGRFFRIVREFWIDRLLIALFMTAGTVTLALVPIPLWIKLMVPLCAFPLVYLLYEWVVAGETIHTYERELPDIARSIARLLDVKVVAFGHTHRPRSVPLRRGCVFVDTGTWAPVTIGRPPGRLKPGLRNFLHVKPDGRDVTVTLGSDMSDS